MLNDTTVCFVHTFSFFAESCVCLVFEQHKHCVWHGINKQLIVKDVRSHLTFLFLEPAVISINTDDWYDSASIREESSRRLRRERGRKLRRYLLIGLATVGGGTVIGDYCCFNLKYTFKSSAIFI